MKTQDFFWPAAHQTPPLSSKQIHVWAWSLDRPPIQIEWEILSDEEVLRARRFINPQHRDRYVRAHSVMRDLLASYSGNRPADIVFSTNDYGKPWIVVQKNSEPVSFNLSHSENTAVLAVSRMYELGVDVELVRPIDQEVAERHFSIRELNTLRSLPPERWLDGFFRCWTSKEALLKGEGLGLNLPLDTFDVQVDPQLPPALLAFRAQQRVTHGWRLMELKPARDVIGTLAVLDGMDAAIKYFSLNG